MGKFILFVLCSVFSTGTMAQKKLLKGIVKDRSTGIALGGATVQLSGMATVTDSEGRFQFEISSGEMLLTIRFVGYEEWSKSINLTGETEIMVEMNESATFTDEVIVLGTRASEGSPSTFYNLNKVAIQKQNFGQDLPYVLNYTPSLVTTSDAGAGIGYTGLRIRGSDATRINVTINGIPLNDSESQGVFWVDVPDIATSAQSIQVQRGVGTSTNGAGAFGGSINLQTNARFEKPYAELINSFGSFNTRRHTLGLGTGMLKDQFTFDARLSLIRSDGFIDRASSDLKSYYLSGGFFSKKTMVKGILFGGREITYQSWYGVPESRLNNDVTAMMETAATEVWNTDQANHLLNSNSRTFNIYSYENQVDNYGQDHCQLHFSHLFTPAFTAHAALHYTYGRGYYEEFRYDDRFANYGVADAIMGSDTISSSDLIRRRWLDNHFYGVTWSLNFNKEKLETILGGAANRYDGDHFGEVIWAETSLTIPKDFEYYFNNGKKNDFNIFLKTNIEISKRLTAFVDLQYRGIDFRASGEENKQNSFGVDAQFHFFNPKFGLTFSPGEASQYYLSYSIANREPVRDDFTDAASGVTPKHETLRNVEAGWRWKRNNHRVNINYYLMDYRNQLVLTGKLNDVGASIRTNVRSSYRTGLELDGSISIAKNIQWNANVTVSQNKIRNFSEVLYDYGLNFDEYNEITNNYKDANISFSPELIAGSTMVCQVKKFELALLTKYVGEQFLDNTSNENRMIDSYFLNDLRFSWTPAAPRISEFSLSLLVNNILDAEYSSNGYTYGFYGGPTPYRQNYFYPQAGRNYLVMLRVRF